MVFFNIEKHLRLKKTWMYMDNIIKILKKVDFRKSEL